MSADRVERVLAALTLDEKCSLTAGSGMWTVPAAPGVPRVTMTDGPNGARGSALLGAGGTSALCVPCGSALGASWDPDLVQRVGAVLGEQARSKDARVLLAPTINLHRHPLGGRGFECYSEDPLLTGAIAASFVRGVQSRGVAATAKHLVANESEFERLTISSQVDERTLRELYLAPFETAVQAGLLAVMTAYNRLNGRWCSEHAPLLTDWLRGEQGFGGVVMTDWFAVGSTRDCAQAGLDLQMPGPDRFFGAPLADAVRTGEVAQTVLDDMVRRWLTLIDTLDAWDDAPTAEVALEPPEHRAVAREAAAAGTVLLANDGLLPLTGAESVALIGPLAARPHVMGGGSAQLRAHRTVSLHEVLAARLGERVRLERGCDIDKTVRPLAARTLVELTGAGAEVREDLRLLWFGAPADGLDEHAFTFTARASLHITQTGLHLFTLVQAGRARLLLDGVVVLDGVSDPPPQGSELFGLGSIELQARVELTAGQLVEVLVEYSAQDSIVLHGVVIGHRPPVGPDPIGAAVEAARAADVAVVVVGTTEEWESEGHDRSSLHLPGEQDELVARVCAANPRTVVVVCAGAPVAMPWADAAAAVLLPWLAGQEGADALDDVLYGAAEPAGRLPVSLPARLEHTPAYGSWPGSNDVAVYSEGLLVGYRWYTTRALPVAFPFGHGGSYTRFSWGPAQASSGRWVPGERVTVTVPVTNTGERRGSEVVQLYVRPARQLPGRPALELRAFARLWLQPGQTGHAVLTLDERAFRSWDPGSADSAQVRERARESALVPAEQGPVPRPSSGWVIEPGRVELLLARSCTDVVQLLPLDLDSG